jgi:hypothetical protein
MMEIHLYANLFYKKESLGVNVLQTFSLNRRRIISISHCCDYFEGGLSTSYVEEGSAAFSASVLVADMYGRKRSKRGRRRSRGGLSKGGVGKAGR